MKNKLFLFVLAVVTFSWLCGNAVAKTYSIGDSQLHLMGYFTQSVQASAKGGDYYDTEEGINSLVTTLIVESDWEISDNLDAFISGGVTADLIYPVKDSDDSWGMKRFDKSRDELAIDDEWWQLLKDAHITWSIDNLSLRVGKQQVRFGQLEVFQVNDWVNPVDMPRAHSEVELEYLFTSIPMVSAQYDFDYENSWLYNTGIQLIFNPNVDHIPDNFPVFGNESAGIWAVDSTMDLGGEVARLGRQDLTILNEPDAFDNDFFEYGIQLSGTINNNVLMLIAFYGRANAPVGTVGGGDFSVGSIVPGWADDTFGPDFDYSVRDSDGQGVVNFADVAIYPEQKFVGFSWAGELPLSSSALGGVKPVYRIEGSYHFDKVFFDENAFWGPDGFSGNFDLKSSLVESDTVILGLNVEQKIRLPWQKGFLSLYGEVTHNRLLDYKSSWSLAAGDLYGRTESFTNFYVSAATKYFRGKLVPMLEWTSYDDGGLQMITPSITYAVNEKLKLKLKATFFEGNEEEYWGYQNKDFVTFKITYNF